jgi:LysR family nitrogen assimilation transcriptional regulator
MRGEGRFEEGRGMDLRALKYVAEAARLGSITKAASALHVAQPALSRQIQLLEDELGVVLLVRHRRGVLPTKEGVDFLKSAEVLLRMAQQLRDDMGSRAAEPAGRIRLGFLPAPGRLVLGKLMAQFIRQYPKVSFQLRESLTADLSEALLTDKLDLAIMVYDVRHQDLHRKPLFAEDVWLVGAPSIWPFGKKPLRPQQLEGLPLIHAAILGSTLERISDTEKLQFRTVIEGDTRTAAREAVREGAGFMLLPESSVTDEVTRGELVGAPIKGFEVTRGLYWRADRPLSRAALEFIGALDLAVSRLKKVDSPIIRNIAGA